MTVDLGGAQLVRRSEWAARPPRSRTAVTPTFGSTVHWEGPHMGPFTHDRCAGKVRAIQNFHMDGRGWADVAYSALVCPHGWVFEGRWVGVRSAANGTTVGNDTAYAVCFLGGVDDPFTTAAQRALRVTLDWLDRHGGAGPSRNCHRDWKPTQCPGDAICTWVRAGQPVDEASPEDDMLTTEDLLAIRGEVQTALRLQARLINGVGGGADADAVWARYVYDGARHQLVSKPVDATEVARLVLVGLPAEAVAAAIPEDIAEDVLDVLVNRLAS